MSPDQVSRRTWSADLSLRHRLRVAVEVMVRGSLTYGKRIDIASQSLIPLRVENFPEELRPTAETLLGVRGLVRHQAAGRTYFVFRDLTPNQRTNWTRALLDTYEALQQDIGRWHPDQD